MRFLRNAFIGLLMLAVTLALILAAVYMVTSARSDQNGGRGFGGGQGRERVFAVNTVPFAPTTHTPILRVFGELQSPRSLDLRSSIGGEVIELHPEFVEGGRVSAQDVLLRLDPTDAQTALARVQADMADARLEKRAAATAMTLAKDELVAAQDQVALRQKSLNRQQDLVTRGVGSAAAIETAELAVAAAQQSVLSRRQSLEQATQRRDQAQAQLDRLALNLQEAERALADTIITAPFDGVLSQIAAKLGGIISPNQDLGQLIDPRQLDVAFRISTTQYTRLLDENGQLRAGPVEVSLNGTDTQVKGTITREAPAVEAGQTGRLIYAKLDVAQTALGGMRGGMRAGDFVHVAIQEAPLENVVKLPATAVSADDQVLVIGDDDRLREAPVTILRRQGDDVLVRGRGLQDQQIVTQRSPLLGTGIKVRLLDNSGAAPVAQAPETVTLSDERRAELIAFVEGNTRMPQRAKDRILGQLAQDQVPAELIQRLEQRMGN